MITGTQPHIFIWHSPDESPLLDKEMDYGLDDYYDSVNVLCKTTHNSTISYSIGYIRKHGEYQDWIQSGRDAYDIIGMIEWAYLPS